MQKNVASQKLLVFAFDSTTNLPKTGDAANLTAYVSKDFGSVTVLGDTSATEMDATNAKGYYLFDLTQGETNADTLLFSAKSSTSNIVVVGAPATVFTTPPNWNLHSIDGSGRVDVIKVAGTSQTARDIGASVLLSAGSGTGQLDFTSGVVKANVTQYGGSAGTFASGRPEVNTTHAAGTAWGSGAITAASIAADAITDAKVAADVTIASVTGAVGSVTGNVGGNVVGTVASVVGNVAGNVTGSVGSVAAGGIASTSFASGAITAASIATDAIGAAEISAAAANKIADHVRRRTQANVEASSDGDTLDLSSEYGVIQMMQEASVASTTMTVKKTDGTTTLGTKTVTVDAAAVPITGVS